MTLSPYYQKYEYHSDAEIDNRANEKKLELSEIFAQEKLETTSDPVRKAKRGQVRLMYPSLF